MAHRSLLLILLAPCGTALLAPPARACTALNAQVGSSRSRAFPVRNAQVGSSSRSRACTKTGPRTPQAPREAGRTDSERAQRVETPNARLRRDRKDGPSYWQRARPPGREAEARSSADD